MTDANLNETIIWILNAKNSNALNDPNFLDQGVRKTAGTFFQKMSKILVMSSIAANRIKPDFAV